MASQDLIVVLGADIGGFQDAMKKAKGTMRDVEESAKESAGGFQGLKSSIGPIGSAIAGAFAIDKIKDFGQSIVNASANAQVVTAQWGLAFEGMESEAEKSLSGIAEKYDILPNRLKPAMASMQSYFKGGGADAESAAKMSEKAMNIAANGAAYYDKSLEDVSGSLKSFMMGNFEAGDAIGINTNKTKIAAEYNKKYGGSFDDVSEQAQSDFLLEYIEGVYSLSGAMEAGANESGGYENQLGNLKQTWADLQARFGEPVLGFVIDSFKTLSGVLKRVDVGAIVGGFASVGGYLRDVFSPVVLDVKDLLVFLWDSFKDSGGIEVVKGILEGIGTVLGGVRDHAELLTPILAGLVGGFIAFKVATGIAALISAVSTALTVLRSGTMIATVAQWALNSALLANPFVLVAVAVGALIVAIISIWKNWDQISAFLLESWEKIKAKASELWTGIKDSISGAVEGVKVSIVEKWTAITTWISQAWQNIKDVASTIWTAIVDFFKKWGIMMLAVIMGPMVVLATFLYKHWDEIKAATQMAWDAIKTKISEVVTAIVAKITEFAGSIKARFEEIKAAVVDKVSKMATDMKAKFVEGVTGLMNSAKEIPGKIGDAIKSAASNVTDGVKALAQKVIDVFKDILGINSPSTIFAELGGYIIEGLKNGLTAENIKAFAMGIFKDISDGAWSVWSDITTLFSGGSLDSIKSFFQGLGGDVSAFFNGSLQVAGSGVDRWRQIATQALMMTGQYSPANLERLLYQMQTESGGNPQAINNWDSNAKKGTPSKGLMQVIDPTFARYKQPGYNNIWNPLDNMLASINYAVSRYGSLQNAYRGTGYAVGGIFKGSQGGSLVKIAENGGDEAVLPLSNKSRMRPFANAVAEMMSGTQEEGLTIVNNFNIASVVIREDADIERIAKALQREQERMDRAGGRVIYGVQI